MKLSRITALLAGAGILAGTQAAFATQGTITFEGEITAATCTVVNSGGPSFTVDLPKVSVNELDASGKTAGWKQFNIELGNCSSATNVKAFFEGGSTVDATSGRLNNMATGGATNVQVALRDTGGAGNIHVGNSSNQWFDVSSGSGTLTYEAGYWATGQATAGLVESSVTYAIEYQ